MSITECFCPPRSLPNKNISLLSCFSLQSECFLGRCGNQCKLQRMPSKDPSQSACFFVIKIFLCNHIFSLQSRWFFAIRMFLKENVEINVNYRMLLPSEVPSQSNGLDCSLSSLQSDAFFTIILFCKQIFFCYQKISFFQDNSNFFIVSP